jgi:hypothetical protein
MARSKTYKKNIACLESLWDHDIENHLSVFPILELTSKRNGVKSIFLTCNTPQELEHNLLMIRRKKGYGILYLAFHGYPGGIFVDGIPVDIEILAYLMGKGFKDWIVHFGCCATMKTPKWKILDFLTETEVLMVSGYTRMVDWVESSALDLLLLNRIQEYKDMQKFWNRFRKAYRDLVHGTGLQAFHREF